MTKEPLYILSSSQSRLSPLYCQGFFETIKFIDDGFIKKQQIKDLPWIFGITLSV